MRRILLIALVCMIPLTGLYAGNKRANKKANADTAEWKYEIEQVATGKSGSIVVKVWSTSKKPNVAAEQAKKNAVHGVIFKGVPAVDRTPGKSPLVTDISIMQSNSAFFDKFFADGGEYMRFVTLTNNGMLDSGDVIKISKKEYKVGVQVTVQHDELRKYLESAGVVRKLGGGF